MYIYVKYFLLIFICLCSIKILIKTQVEFANKMFQLVSKQISYCKYERFLQQNQAHCDVLATDFPIVESLLTHYFSKVLARE